MPAGQATSRIDARIGVADVDTREFNRVLESATPRLEAAWKAGIIRYEDILDAASTKPKARAALMAQLDAQKGQAELASAQIAGAKARLPVTEKAADDTALVNSAMAARAVQRVGTVNDALDAKAKSEAANAGLGAAIDEAVAAGATPDTIQGLANAKLDTMRFGAAAGAMQATRTAADMERAMLSNPTRDTMTKLLSEEGVLADPLDTDEDVARKTREMIEHKFKRENDFKLAQSRAASVAASYKDAADRGIGLFKDYSKNEYITNAMTVKTQYGIVQRMIQKGANDPTGASDMAAIFAFMKMLDPTSVVREGEYIRASRTSPLVSRFLPDQIWDVVTKGAILTPASRAAFLNSAREAIQPHLDTADEYKKGYDATATYYGVDPRVVTGNIDYSVPKFEANQALGDPGPGNVWMSNNELKDGDPNKYYLARPSTVNGKTVYHRVESGTPKPKGGPKPATKQTENGSALIHAPAGSPAAQQIGF